MHEAWFLHLFCFRLQRWLLPYRHWTCHATRNEGTGHIRFASLAFSHARNCLIWTSKYFGPRLLISHLPRLFSLYIQLNIFPSHLSEQNSSAGWSKSSFSRFMKGFRSIKKKKRITFLINYQKKSLWYAFCKRYLRFYHMISVGERSSTMRGCGYHQCLTYLNAQFKFINQLCVDWPQLSLMHAAPLWLQREISDRQQGSNVTLGLFEKKHFDLKAD